MSVTLVQFLRRFSTERACLEYVASCRWPEGITCPKCERVTKHHLIEKRKCYSCVACSHQTYVTAGTIFHRSRTPLVLWLYCIFTMSHTRTGVSARQIERETGVTHKTAWRMCQLVRAALAEGGEAAVFGTVAPVEMDETYIGGKPRYKGQSRAGRGTRKQPVFGIVERGQDGKPKRVRAFVVGDTKKDTVMPLIEKNVAPGATCFTDDYSIYRTLGRRGYDHDWVRHRRWEYAKERVDYVTGEVLSKEGERPVHTNAIEGFWSQVRGAVINVHRGVASRYLGRYVDEMAWRYSNRDSGDLFGAMVSRAVASRRDARRPAIPPR